MRWLWALLALLGVAAAILWSRGSPSPRTDPEHKPEPARAEPAPVLRGTPEPQPEIPPEPQPEIQPEPSAESEAETQEALADLASKLMKEPEPEPPEIREPLRADTPPEPDPIQAQIDAASRALDELLKQQGLEGAAPAEPKAEPEPEPVDESPLPAKVEKREDGTMMIDDRFVVRGAGTAESPYVVPWELLVAAQQAYAPRLGKKRLPESVTMFSGTVVEITGYVAFPMLQDTSDELLAMLNMWDGCCIGIPPTPYDAIEVKLSRKAEGDERFARYGTIRGTFGVKPHLVGQWLVGLYVMDNATLETKEFGGFGS